MAREQKLSLKELSDQAAQDPSIDHMLDERTKAEAEKGGVVIDAQLAAWIAGDLADVKVLLTAPDEVRFRRIAERDHVGVEQARKETEYRESIQLDRYKKYYGIDVSDLSIYCLKIDTSQHEIETTKKIIINSVRDLLSKRTKPAARG
jgi:cytidylate kinase